MATLGALFFVALTAFVGALYLPAEKAELEDRVASVRATSLLAYRESVINYLNANPSFTGTVPDSSLTFPWGYVRDSRWTNLVPAAGTLYVYSTATDLGLVEDHLYRKTLRSFMVGRKVAGQLVAANGFATGITLPAAIPDGALVFAGR